MQTVEPFDCTAELGAVVIHSMPGLRHYNPIGSVHGGYAAILLDSAMGLAVQSTLPAGTGYTTLEFKISFVRGMKRDERRDPHRGPRAQRRPPRRYRGGTYNRCKGSADCACDDDVPCVGIFSEGERERLTLNWRVPARRRPDRRHGPSSWRRPELSALWPLSPKTWRLALTMSVSRGRPEVVGRRAK